MQLWVDATREVMLVWGNALLDGFGSMVEKVVSIVPNIILAVIIFAVGWLMGSILCSIIERIFRTLKIDEALKEEGFGEVVARSGLKLNSGYFFGEIAKWFVVLAFLIASFDVLNLTAVTDSLKSIVLDVLPNVIVAALILLIALVIADAVKKAVIASARTAGIHSANFVGTVAKWAIWIFAAFTALSRLGLWDAYLNTLLEGIIIAFSLAIGLAFGLGGQDAAAEYIEKIRDEIESHTEGKK